MVDRYLEFAPERERKRESAQRTHREKEREREKKRGKRERNRAPSLAAHRHDRGGIAKLSTSSF